MALQMLFLASVITTNGCLSQGDTKNPSAQNKFPLSKQSPFDSSQRGEVKIVIKKHEFKLYCYRGNSLLKSYPIAIGKNYGDKKRPGDKRTPEGNFYIVSIENSKSWVHDFGDGKGAIKGAYGPWFLRLYTGADRTKSGKKWNGIGIHGTHDPSSIGKMITDGCIRMHNKDIEELRKFIKIGTPVSILEKGK